jgi:uncharacterized UBP type Zn finger protein
MQSKQKEGVRFKQSDKIIRVHIVDAHETATDTSVSCDPTDTSVSCDSYSLFRVSDPQKAPISVTMTIEGINVPMELDTGAAVSVVSETTLKSLPQTLDLKPVEINLKTYTGETIPTIGQTFVEV